MPILLDHPRRVPFLRGGYKLVYTDKPNEGAGNRRDAGGADFTYPLGLGVNKDMKITSVLWNSPDFDAGLASSMSIVAINGSAAKTDGLKRAIIANQKTGTPITLLVNDLYPYWPAAPSPCRFG